jgi:hypothetical protein
MNEYFIGDSDFSTEYMHNEPYAIFKRDSHRYYFFVNTRASGPNQQYYLNIFQTDDGGKNWYKVHVNSIKVGVPANNFLDLAGQPHGQPGSELNSCSSVVYNKATDTFYIVGYDTSNGVYPLDTNGLPIFWTITQNISDIFPTGDWSGVLSPVVWKYNGTTGALSSFGNFGVSLETNFPVSFNGVGGVGTDQGLPFGMALSNDGTKFLSAGASPTTFRHVIYLDTHGNFLTSCTIVDTSDVYFNFNTAVSTVPFLRTHYVTSYYIQHGGIYKDQLTNRAYIRSIRAKLDLTNTFITNFESEYAVLDLVTGTFVDQFSLPSLTTANGRWGQPLFYTRGGHRYLALCYCINATVQSDIYLYIRNLDTSAVVINTNAIPTLTRGNLRFPAPRLTYDANLDKLYIWRTVSGFTSSTPPSGIYCHTANGDGTSIGTATSIHIFDSTVGPYVEQFGESAQLDKASEQYGLVFSQEFGGGNTGYYWLIGDVSVGSRWKTLEV